VQQDPGIELLVTLAKNEEIDPWHVDIIQVTDKYLAALDRMEDRTLAASGKCIFYACVLLHMKARLLATSHLLQEPIIEADSCEPFDDGFDDDQANEFEWAKVVSTNNGVLLLPRGRPRCRPINLDDLIKALKRCDEFERKRREAGLPPTTSFVDTTHHDDVTGDVERVRGLLLRIVRGTGPVAFQKLLGEGLSAGGVFLALLFMAAGKEISLIQERFYQDLSVVAFEEEAA